MFPTPIVVVKRKLSDSVCIICIPIKFSFYRHYSYRFLNKLLEVQLFRSDNNNSYYQYFVPGENVIPLVDSAISSIVKLLHSPNMLVINDQFPKQEPSIQLHIPITKFRKPSDRNDKIVRQTTNPLSSGGR